MFQPVGGMDRIPAALTRAIGERRIRTGAAVSKITDAAHGVTVTYTRGGRTHTVEADYCIAALPPNILAKTAHNLGPAVQSALEACKPSSAGKIGLEYKSRWWETDHQIYGGITETDMDLSHIWYPSYGHQGRRGTVIGYYNYGADADAYAALTPREREARAIAQGVKIHGEKYRTELAASFSHHWRQTPHLEAAWHSLSGGPDAPAFAPLNQAADASTSPVTTSATPTPGSTAPSPPHGRRSPHCTRASWRRTPCERARAGNARARSDVLP